MLTRSSGPNRRYGSDYFLPQGLFDFLQDTDPVAKQPLPEQPHGRIPRRIGSVFQPAPVTADRQQDPDRTAQGSGQMGHGRVAGDDQVQVLQNGCRIGETPVLIASFENRQRPPVQIWSNLLFACPFLQTDKVDRGYASQRGEQREREGSEPVSSMGWAPLPAQSDLETGQTLQMCSPA